MRLLLVLFFTLFSVLSYAATIDRVEISGNRRVPDSRITPHLVKAGSDFDPAKINESIKKLHATGYFMEISVDAEVVGSDFVITYILHEMPLIANIQINGTKRVTKSKLEEVLEIKTGDTMSLSKIGNTLRRIRNVYEKDQFYGVVVTHRIEYRNELSVSLIFDVVEGKKSRVYNIWFYGNKTIDGEELKLAMDTKEKNFWSKLNSSGTLMREVADYDSNLVAEHYRSLGFLNVEVSEPEILFQEDPSRMNYILRVNEGDRYTLEKVEFSDPYGVLTAEEMEARTRLKPGEYFNVLMYRDDIRRLTDAYMEIGYARANIEPETLLNDIQHTVTLSYTADPGNIYTINRIIFSGNNKSKDNVLRRQFDIYEGDQYSLLLLNEAERNLYSTGFYESVRINERFLTDNITDVIVTVEEKKSSTLMFGAAYSSEDQFMVQAEFTENNLFGYGTTASIAGRVSTTKSNYTLNYVDPWLFDRPYSMDVTLFSRNVEYDEYTRDAYGGSLVFGHQPIKRRLFVNYGFSHEQIRIKDIDSSASAYIKRQKGLAVINALIPSVVYSDLNNNLDPTQGIKVGLYSKYAGTFLGGNKDFLKLELDGQYYIPMSDKTTLVLHGKVGKIWDINGKEIPIDERYFLGGINTIRGFDYRDISPNDEDGEPYGGNQMYLGNIELVRTLFEGNMTIRGVLFYDFGNTTKEGQSLFEKSPRNSVGAGFRFVTPMGLMRLEYGVKLDRRKGESSSKWEFSIGSAF